MPQDNESIVSTVNDGDTKEKINISISNLIAKNTNHSSIVRFNSNYRAIFDFDLNSGSNALTWGAADKQAKFVWTAPNGEQETAVKDILFDGDTGEYYCDIPIVENGAESMLIGAIGTSATAHEVVQDKYLIDKGLVDDVEWTATHYHPTQEGICNYITNNNVMGVYIHLPRIERTHDTLSIKLSSEINISQYNTLYYHVKDYKAPYNDSYGGTSIQMLINEQSTSLTTGLHKIDITGDTISIEILTAGEYGYLPSTGEDYESYILFDKMWLTKENVEEEEEEEEEDSSLKNLYTTTSAFVMCVQSIHEIGNPTLGATDNGASTIDIDDTENAGVRITPDGYLLLNCNQTTPGSGASGESRPLMTNGEVITYGVGKVIPHEVSSELDENNNTLINFVYNLAPIEGTGEIIRGPGITNISFDSETGYLTIYYSDNKKFTIEQSLIGPQGPKGDPGQDGEVSYEYINEHFTTSYDSTNKKLTLNINYPLI